MYMKKLTKLHLKSARVLNASEMKRICGGSGYGRESKFNCMCSQIDVEQANESGYLPPATLEFEITATSTEEAESKLKYACSGYTQIHCVSI